MTICGIAGYCISDSLVDSFGKHRAERIARDALAFNRHRGLDAAGWYVQYVGEHTEGRESNTMYYKQPGDASNIEVLPSGKPSVLAAHTRAATEGTPYVNANNHPLIVGKAIGVHNGGVRNDMFLQHSLQVPEGYEWPQVDSAVLIAGFNHFVQDPLDEKQIGEFVEWLDDKVYGAAAIALSLSTHPGIQVISRKSMSPLTVGLVDGGVFWASEEDALFKIVQRMGIASSSVDFFSLEEGSLIVVDRGEIKIVKSWEESWASTGWTSGKRYKDTHVRVSAKHPEIEFDEQGMISGWDKDLSYRIDRGYGKEHEVLSWDTMPETWGKKISRSLARLIADADDVLFTPPKNYGSGTVVYNPYSSVDARFHLLYYPDGEDGKVVEVVSDGRGNVQDVYSWSKGEGFDDKWKPIVSEEEVSEKVDNSDLSERLFDIVHATLKWHEPKNPFNPNDKTNTRLLSFSERSQRRNAATIGVNNRTVSTCPVPDIRSKVFHDTVRVHLTPWSILSDDDTTCSLHEKRLSWHDQAEAVECEEMQWALLHIADVADNVEELKMIMDDVPVIKVETNTQTYHTIHDWVPFALMAITSLNGDDLYIPVGDSCAVCGLEQKVLPSWWLYDEDYVIEWDTEYHKMEKKEEKDEISS